MMIFWMKGTVDLSILDTKNSARMSEMADTYRNVIARKRHPDGDYYATDPQAAKDILRLEPQLNDIWEPACGAGHLAKEFFLAGKLRLATDIVNRGFQFQDRCNDFLMLNEEWRGDIITNPPYNLAAEFVLHALKIVPSGSYVVMFLPITFLESQSRYSKIFLHYPPKRVHVYAKRMRCLLNGDFERSEHNTMKCYAWFVWQNGFAGAPVLDWIVEPLKEERQGVLA